MIEPSGNRPHNGRQGWGKVGAGRAVGTQNGRRMEQTWGGADRLWLRCRDETDIDLRRPRTEAKRLGEHGTISKEAW